MLNSPAWAVLSLNRALHQRAHLFENTKSEHDDLCPTDTTSTEGKKNVVNSSPFVQESGESTTSVCAHMCESSSETPEIKSAEFVPMIRVSEPVTFVPSWRIARWQD